MIKKKLTKEKRERLRKLLRKDALSKDANKVRETAMAYSIILGDERRAAEAYEQAAKLDERKEGGIAFQDYRSAAQRWVKVKEYEKAAENIEKAIAILPNPLFMELVQLYGQAASFYEKAGKKDKTKKLRKKLENLTKGQGLESRFAILLIGALCVGCYFLFSNSKVRGNVVASLDGVSSSFMSLILIGVLVLVIYYYSK